MPYLHQMWPDLRETLPHISLGETPTPVRCLDGLSSGGADIWLKDESQFGSGGWGGNKVRKLEWLLADAQQRNRKTILTFGGLGTNWGLATALYAREQDIETVLALVDQPRDEHVERQLERLRESGATIHYTRSRNRTIAMAPWLLARHTNGFRPPYVLPAGGSSPLGTLGYVETALEIADQVQSGELPEPSHVVTAIGSGGTVAGLALGFQIAGLKTIPVGVLVSDLLPLDQRSLNRLADRSAKLLTTKGAALPPLPRDSRQLSVTSDWLGPGYGQPTPESTQAIEAAAEYDLNLDPVYTGKAMAATLAMNERGSFGPGPVLFLNTNGPR